MADLRKHSSTSNIVRFTLKHATTGVGLTGLSSASSGLIISTICGNEATATTYTVAGATIESITTLGTFAAPTATKCRFKEVDATNHKGLYEFQFADARFSVASALRLVISVTGATNLLDADYEVQLTQFDMYTATQKVDIETIKTQAVTCSGGVTVPAATLASTTNITAATGIVLSGVPHTGATIPTVTDVTNLHASAATAANQTTILNRLGAWTGTGINTVLGAFRALCAKAASLTPTDISTSTTFDNTTDSAEALRDRGDAAWITATGFALASVCTEGRLAELDAANLPTDIAGVQSDTDNIQARLPAALSAGGNMKSDVLEVNASTNAAANLARGTLGVVLGTATTGGTTTSIPTSSLDPAASVTDQYKGRIVTFDRATTTVALRGQSTDITASTAGGTLTVTALTTAPASGDTFTIT